MVQELSGLAGGVRSLMGLRGAGILRKLRSSVVGLSGLIGGLPGGVSMSSGGWFGSCSISRIS